jgi:hypothetical protein
MNIKMDKTKLEKILLGILATVIIGLILHIGIKGEITGKVSLTECTDVLYPSCGGGSNGCESKYGPGSDCVQSGYGCVCTAPPISSPPGGKRVGHISRTPGTPVVINTQISTTKEAYELGEYIELS